MGEQKTLTINGMDQPYDVLVVDGDSIRSEFVDQQGIFFSGFWDQPMVQQTDMVVRIDDLEYQGKVIHVESSHDDSGIRVRWFFQATGKVKVS